MADYLVVDLEADERIDPHGRKLSEAIEIGAVAYDSKCREVVAEYRGFVRPTWSRLSDWIVSFCSYSPEERAAIEAAPSFPDALATFLSWVDRTATQVLFCSWGDYDRKQLVSDCQLHKIEVPPWLLRHANLKADFARLRGARPSGMARALRTAGLRLVGTHHKGLDDARNIARLLGYLLERDHLPVAFEFMSTDALPGVDPPQPDNP